MLWGVATTLLLLSTAVPAANEAYDNSQQPHESPPKAESPATIQERAWSSPIWYTPEPKLAKKAAFYPHLHQIMN